MHALDRKIAELKGWRPITAADLEKKAALQKWCPEDRVVGCRDREDGGLDFGTHKDGEPTWSTSDSKALELVDELERGTPGILFSKFFFRLERMENGQGWKAVFITDTQGCMIPSKKFTGQDTTRPKAICRAWLAAAAHVEWMKEKKG